MADKKLKEKTPEATPAATATPPSKPKPKEETSASKPTKWRQGKDIKAFVTRIGDSNCITIATSKTKLVEMGLHFVMGDSPTPYILTISIPKDFDGNRDDMQIGREDEQEAQVLYNAFPRKVPFHALPAGCDLEQAPEKKRKKATPKPD